MFEDISKLEDVNIIDKWFRIDNKPFKQSLLDIIKKWSSMFKNHLMNDVINRSVIFHDHYFYLIGQ